MKAAVALGSNLAEPEAQVERGFEEIAALPQTRLVARSKLYRTAPVGYIDQPDFINACAVVETALEPRALLDALLAVEAKHGRVRDMPNGPRTLDLDIVLYGDRAIDEPGLRVPHPRAHERAFVLVPLVDAWPDAVIPGHGPARECLAKVVR
jgi:2-amino-4-hydroxy-6-hydroxymethyldihydropteridine diphosphokinase